MHGQELAELEIREPEPLERLADAYRIRLDATAEERETAKCGRDGESTTLPRQKRDPVQLQEKVSVLLGGRSGARRPRHS